MTPLEQMELACRRAADRITDMTSITALHVLADELCKMAAAECEDDDDDDNPCMDKI